ncbi:MAG: hypothetical protein LBC87_04465 [Fibromonadaceae bacterium]|jgi:hypothetical protein|nr:hypothetical protein [Fibromonadaceae bacterium]
MNKLFLFLAFAAFALVACSEDKPAPLHSELCKKATITEECLVGRWGLADVEGGYSECKPNPGSELKLTKDGRFVFNGAYGGYPEMEKMGTWELIDGGMKITFTAGDYDPRSETIDAGIEIRNTVQLELRIKTTSYTGFLQCSENTSAAFTEVFVWRSEK